MSTTHEILKDAMSNAEPDDIQTHKDIYCEPGTDVFISWVARV